MSRKRSAESEPEQPAVQRRRYDTLPTVLLHHAATFLDLRDIRALLSVSRACARLRGQSADTAVRELTVKSVAEVTLFHATGSWKTFVTSLRIDMIERDANESSALLLHTLAEHVPHLRRLYIENCHPRCTGVPQLPRGITHFEFHPGLIRREMAFVGTPLMTGVGALPQLQQARVRVPTHSSRALHHLCTSPCLTLLDITAVALDDELVHALKTTTTLRVVILNVAFGGVPDDLFDVPLGWTTLILHVAHTRVTEFPTARFPALTALETNLRMHTTQPWHTNIKRLCIEGDAFADDHAFTGVTHLAVRNATNAFLAIVPQLPVLRSLELLCMPEVTTLGFLRRLPHLTRLAMWDGRVELNGDNLASVASVRELEHLSLEDVFRPPLNSSHTYAFHPPSLLLPKLQTFAC